MENYLNKAPIPDDSEFDHPTLNDCWNQIGVMGDRTCGELKTVIHCPEPCAGSLGGWTHLARAQCST
jgi:hypothetical protein